MRSIVRRVAPALLVAVVVGAGAAHAHAEKIAITKLSDLPPHAYTISMKPSELAQDAAAVDALAAEIEANLRADLEKYDIQDRSALRRIHGTLLTIAMLQGDEAEVRSLVETVRELQEKPAQKLTSGLLAEAMLAAKAAKGDEHETLRATLQQSLEALPYQEVQDVLKQNKASFEILSPSLMLGGLQAQADPAAKDGTIGEDIAAGVVQVGYVLREVLPFKDDVVSAYTAVLDANKEERKSDIWGVREVTLTADQKTTPVLLAVWDSGVDVALYPEQLWVNPKETPGNGKDDDKNGFVDDVNGIAWTLHSDPTPDLLFPIAKEIESPDTFKGYMKGLTDLQENIDSPAASDLKQDLAGLKQNEVKPFLEGLTAYSQYAHGTHVAGIALKGNPAARLMACRITFDYHAPPEKPTVEQAKKDGASMAKTVQYFTKHKVRVVNMSWGGDLRSIEVALEQNQAGGTPEERRALARKIYDIGYNALFKALEGAPQTLFVIAAGNSDNDVKFDEVMPSSFKLPNVIVAGAVDQAGERTGFTSFGNVDVYSNGFEVESYLPGGEKIRLNGTSMAAPNVTNLAAKLWALHPELSVAQVKQYIVDGADEKVTGETTMRLLNPKASIGLAAERVQ